MQFARPYKKIFIATLTLTIILGFIAPVRPIIIKIMVDDFIPNKDKQKLLEYSLFLITLLLGESLLQYFQIYLANLLGQNIIRDLRVKLYKKILRLNLTYFDKTPIGTLITRVVSDIETIAEVFST